MATLNFDFLDAKPTFGLQEMEHTSVPRNFFSADQSLMIPPVQQPESFLRDFGGSAAPAIRLLHGTTTLGFKFDGGIIVAVDSRASQGQYVASQTVKKVIEINPQLIGTMAGGAADCQYWERYLGMRCRLYELQNKERMTVAAASKLLANILYNYKGMGLSVGTMIAGWDDKRGPNLYHVDSEGTRLKGDVFSVGSGSTYAYGVLDQGYRADLSVEEAIDLGRRAIYHATHRDAYSGGIINVYHIKAGGWEKISANDSGMEMHYKYEAAKAKAMES